MVTSPIDFASSFDLNVSATIERKEVFVISWNITLSGPMFDTLRCYQFSNDGDCYVVYILYSNGHWIEAFIGYSNDSFGSERGIGSFDCIEDGFLVFELICDGIWVGYCSEMGDIVERAAQYK